MEARKIDRRYTVEEYLAYDASIVGRAEYHDGYIVDMAGGTPEHSQINANLVGLLKSALIGKGCIVYTSDAKVKSTASNSYLYPDVTVSCGLTPDQRRNSQFVPSPTLIVEVLSESTVSEDLGFKFFAYQRIPTLNTYILVDQYCPAINIMHRNDGGDWIVKTYVGLEGAVELSAFKVSLDIAMIYEDVIFPDNKPPLLGRM